MHGNIPEISAFEQKKQEVDTKKIQGQLQLHGKFEAILGYPKPCDKSEK